MPKMTFFGGIFEAICVSPRSEFQRIFSRGFDSPDVFLLRKSTFFAMSSQSHVTPSSASPVWQPRKASQSRTFFGWHDFRHKCWELDSLYFTSIFKIWMFFLCLIVGEQSSLGPRELIVGWLLLVGCSPEELSPSTPSSTGPLPCRSTHVLPQEPPKQASHTPPSGIHGS